MAEALERALSMPLAERQARHRDMMAPLRENNLSVWRDNFMRDLQAAGVLAEGGGATPRRASRWQVEAACLSAEAAGFAVGYFRQRRKKPLP